MNNKTEVEKYFKDLIEYMNTSVDKNELTQEVADIYVEFSKSCKNLMDTIDNYADRTNLTTDDKNNILDAYQKVTTQTTKLLQIKNDNDSNNIKPIDKDETLISIGYTIDNILSKDIKNIALMQEGSSLKETIVKARTKLIDITNQKKEYVGGNSNVRQVINMGNNKKGVFTPKTGFDADKQVDEFIDKFSKKYPEFKNTINAIRGIPGEDYKAIGQKYKPHWEKVDKYDSLEIERREIQELAYRLCGDNVNARVFNELLGRGKGEIVKHFLFEFCSELANLGNTKKLNQALMGSKKGEFLEEKNSAMTVIAGLLGMDDLIAHSENVVVKDGNKVQEGCVMDFAEGKDMLHIKDDDPMIKYGLEAYDTPEAKKQMSNMQILDLICGNIDRHLGNMLYNFEETNEGPKLKKIVGIDNDLSFPNNNVPFVKVNGGVDYKSALFMVDEQTADKIKSLSPSMIRLALQGFGLSKEAIYYTTERFSNIKEAITNNGVVKKENEKFVGIKKNNTDPKKCNANIIPKDKWNDVPFSLMYYGNDCTIAGRLNKERKVFFYMGKESYRKKNNIVLQNNNMYSIVSNGKRQFEDCVTKLDKVTNFFKGTSTEFKNVVETLKNYSKGKDIIYNLNQMDFDKFTSTLNQVKSQIDVYLNKKQTEKTRLEEQGKTLSDYANSRIEAMADVRKGIVELNDKFNQGLKEWKKARGIVDVEVNKDIEVNEDEKVFSKEDNEEIMKIMRKEDTEKSLKIENTSKEIDTIKIDMK